MQQAARFISMCVTPIAFSQHVLWYRARKSRPHDIDRPVDISLKYVADTKGHVVEKAVKHPACCTVAQSPFFEPARFLYLIICTLFCSVPLFGKAV